MISLRGKGYKMRNCFYIESGQNKYRIFAYTAVSGKDVSILIGGGEKPHIGAVAIATPRKSLKNDGTNSASASVICIVGHKDDEIARKAALTISSKFNINVVVSVGLHIDCADNDDIEQLQKNFKNILLKIIESLKI